MLDCFDYTTETSNEEKLPFLELIEAVSRSHRDSLSNDARYLNSNDLYNFTVSSTQHDTCISSSAGRQNVTTYYTTMEADDHLNMTDCDLNLLVDPRNGRPLFDDDNEEEEDDGNEGLKHEIKQEKIDDESDNASDFFDKPRFNNIHQVMSEFDNSSFDFQPNFSSDEITDTSTQFNILPIKIEPLDLPSSDPSQPIKVEQSDAPPSTNNEAHKLLHIDDQSITNNISNNNLNNIISNTTNNNNIANNNNSSSNRVLLIQIASPVSNVLKLNKNEITVQHQQQQKSCPIKSQPQCMEKFDKPPFSYSCLIAMALRNSENGFLPVSEIYSYIIDKFPYFKTAPDGWKNSIRHNLSLNKCFQKLETPSLNGATRKACLWGLNEAKVSRLNDEISKWIKKGNDSNSGKKYYTSSDLSSQPQQQQQQLLSKPPLILNEDAQHGNPATAAAATTTSTTSINDLWLGACANSSNNSSSNLKNVINDSNNNNRVTSVDPTEFKLYKLIKVSKNNDSFPVLNEVDPIFTAMNNQTMLTWNDMDVLMEVGENINAPTTLIAPASTSHQYHPQPNQRIIFGSVIRGPDPSLSLKTVSATA